jgi:DNA-binding response OmpR family regulator
MAENKILIVEDEANLLETLRYNLRKEDYDAVTARIILTIMFSVANTFVLIMVIHSRPIVQTFLFRDIPFPSM